MWPACRVGDRVEADEVLRLLHRRALLSRLAKESIACADWGESVRLQSSMQSVGREAKCRGDS